MKEYAAGTKKAQEFDIISGCDQHIYYLFSSNSLKAVSTTFLNAQVYKGW